MDQYQQWQMQYAQYFGQQQQTGAGASGGVGVGAEGQGYYHHHPQNPESQAHYSMYPPGAGAGYPHYPHDHSSAPIPRKKKESKFKEDPVKEGELVDRIVNEMKSKGLVDEFRRDVMGGCELNPFYQQLEKRVSSTVRSYLDHVKWISTLNRNVARETMRRKIVDSSYFYQGIEKILENTMQTKANDFFMPSIEECLEEHMPKKEEKKKKPTDESNSKEENDNRVKDDDTGGGGPEIPSTSELPPLPRTIQVGEESNDESVDMECDSNSNKDSPPGSVPPGEEESSKSGSEPPRTPGRKHPHRRQTQSSVSSPVSESSSRKSKFSESGSENIGLPRTPELQPPIPSADFNDSEDMEIDEEEEEEESPAFEMIGQSPTNSPLKSLSSPMKSAPLQTNPVFSPVRGDNPLTESIAAASDVKEPSSICSTDSNKSSKASSPSREEQPMPNVFEDDESRSRKSSFSGGSTKEVDTNPSSSSSMKETNEIQEDPFISPEASPLYYFPPLSSPMKRKLAYYSKYVDPLLMESDVSLVSMSSESEDETRIQGNTSRTRSIEQGRADDDNDEEEEIDVVGVELTEPTEVQDEPELEFTKPSPNVQDDDANEDSRGVEEEDPLNF